MPSTKKSMISEEQLPHGGNNRIYVFAAILAIAVVLAYSNHFYNDFHFDDSHAVVTNLYIRSLRNIPLFFRDATTFSSLPANQMYRPVVLTSLALDYFLGKGLHPFYFHLSMFALFIVQGFFMYMLYIKIFYISEKHKWSSIVALLAVAWYLLHPANAETVNYISARSDTLSTLFGLVSMVLFMYSDFCRKRLIYLVPLTIAVLAKPIAVFFVLLIMVYVYLFEDVSGAPAAGKGKTKKKKTTPSYSSSVLKKTWPALLYALFLMIFTKAMTPPTFSPGGAPLVNYLITQPYVVLHYFTTFFLPVSLSADTDWGPLASAADPRFFAGLVFIGILLYAAFASAKNRNTRPVAFGIFWFFIALLPTSLFPLAEVMNDHRIFFPYVGLTMSVVWSLWLIYGKMKKSFSSEQAFNSIVIVMVCLLLAGYAYGAHERNKVWKTEESLWHDVTIKSPKNGRGLMNYGLVLMGRNDYAGAEKYFTEAMRYVPNYSYLHVNMGILKAAIGRPEEAEQYFKKAMSLDSKRPAIYFYYARFLKKQGRFDEAIEKLLKALDLSQAHLDSRYMLMEIYLQLHEYESLRELVTQTLRIAPDDQKAAFYLDALKNWKSGPAIPVKIAEKNRTPKDFLDLSLHYYRLRQFDKSIDAANKALKLKPDYDLAYNNICAAYNELKQWDKAIEAGEKAVKLNPDNQLARNNIAWAKTQKKMQ